MHLLVAFANDRQGRFLRHIAEEHAVLLEVFAAAGLQPLSLPAAGVANLLQSFQRHRNEICLLHYGGHADNERL